MKKMKFIIILLYLSRENIKKRCSLRMFCPAFECLGQILFLAPIIREKRGQMVYMANNEKEEAIFAD
jgi:hypothetical protein